MDPEVISEPEPEGDGGGDGYGTVELQLIMHGYCTTPALVLALSTSTQQQQAATAPRLATQSSRSCPATTCELHYRSLGSTLEDMRFLRPWRFRREGHF